MISGDEILFQCNESELLWMARIQGHPPLRRGLPREELIALVAGDSPVEQRHVAGTYYTRARLQEHIQKNIDRVRGYLPGCNGMCSSFMCTEEKHMSCFIPSEPHIL